MAKELHIKDSGGTVREIAELHVKDSGGVVRLVSEGYVKDSGGVIRQFWPNVVPLDPPVNAVAPVISGSTAIGSTLTSTQGTWTGAAPITYGYQWAFDGVPISGETATTYVTVPTDSGADITCIVTATNADGIQGAFSNIIVPEANGLANSFLKTLLSNGLSSVTTSIVFATDGSNTGIRHSQANVTGSWYTPNTAAIGDLFEVRLTVITGDTPTGSTVGSFIPLTSGVTWTVNQSSSTGITSMDDGTIEFREIANPSNNLIVTNVYLSAEIT